MLDQHRKERVRLAQRAYRNRRDTKVDDLKVRVARLEQALEQTTSSFTRFQDRIGADEDLPPRLALEISRTALEIAKAVRETHSEEPLREVQSSHDGEGLREPVHSESTVAATNSEKGLVGNEVLLSDSALVLNAGAAFYNDHDFSSIDAPDPMLHMGSSPRIAEDQQHLAARTMGRQQGTWFTSLLLQLCLEQGMQLLTSPYTTAEDLHPALSIHLTWLTIEQFREQCIRARARNFENLHEDPAQAAVFGSPLMYRSIEGNEGLVVPRLGKSEPQQLVYGRTRTRVVTNLRDFQGEWLEPVDVQEFLEDRGIFLGAGGIGEVLHIAVPEGILRDICSHDANAMFAEEIQRSMNTISQLFIDEGQSNDAMIHSGGATQLQKYPAQMIAGQYDPLVSTHRRRLMTSRSFPYQEAQSGRAQYTPVNPTGASESLINITLHLDRLMRFLVVAASCIGSGPGIRKEAIEHAMRVSIVKD